MQATTIFNRAEREQAEAARAAGIARQRDIEGEIADFMVEHPGCTADDLRAAGFDGRQIETHAVAAARRAARRWTRRVN